MGREVVFLKVGKWDTPAHDSLSSLIQEYTTQEKASRAMIAQWDREGSQQLNDLFLHSLHAP